MTDMIDPISILLGVVTFFYIVRLNDLNYLLQFDYNSVMGNKKEKKSIKNKILRFIFIWIFTVILPIGISLPSLIKNILNNINELKKVLEDLTIAIYASEMLIIVIVFISCICNCFLLVKDLIKKLK
ncbi:MAG: hypothetical protein MR739_02520 [Spirochaetia bacterium]|nr:hypothetical protein [Spirochaetia bacterium]